MTEDTATPEGLADEEVVSEAPAQEGGGLDLGALYDKLNAGDDETADEPDDTEEGADDSAEGEAEEPKPESVQIPSELPASIRKDWANLSEEARDAILTREREANRKLAEVGRMNSGLAPIRDELVNIARDFPDLADMKPQQVAKVLRETAQSFQKLNADPLNTLMGEIQRRGLTDAARQALGGQQPQQESMHVSQLLQKIEGLERHIARISDPSVIDERVMQINQQQTVQGAVEELSRSAPHWAAVEEALPNFIQAAQAIMPNASPSEVLQEAYQMAVQRIVPETDRATPQAADKAATADPERTRAALKARAVNVNGKASGTPRPMTNREAMSATYDRLMSS